MAGRDAVHALAGAGADAVMSTRASSAAQSLRIGRAPLMSRLIGKAMALGYRLVGKDRYDDYRLERIGGAPFLVIPTVFHPKGPRTGEFFASLLYSNPVWRGAEVLDLGARAARRAGVARQTPPPPATRL